ncbi:glycerophosphodiester phosphodiesterase [Paenibacillus cremeus]|uniref:Glycerophosphodiester phosphodiesterase n=1 Tax=Paenibacillus cremeus TaxID=2163881 RepID=A0A559KCB5_9BACL|nr:glycerophosphodiester phosphodiesterase [Paenibacillus cremeus]TVY09761.1 glycerophosphodiester phosphodiesterase [Paenibacillus cremeus]
MTIGSKHQPLIIGHRGAKGSAPENTLAAFALAFEQGAEAIELDVQESADGELIVCHDATVDRTTNGKGRIAELTVAELQKLDAGGWYHERFAGEKLPTLAEVFELVPVEYMINVEIKCPFSERLFVRLKELLEQYDRLQSVVVSSFNHKLLQELKQRLPELKAGLLYEANFTQHRKMAEGSGIGVFSLHPQFRLIGAEDVKDALAHGLQVYPYTINELTDLQRAVEAGVSGIITDYPDRLKRLLAGE